MPSPGVRQQYPTVVLRLSVLYHGLGARYRRPAMATALAAVGPDDVQALGPGARRGSSRAWPAASPRASPAAASAPTSAACSGRSAQERLAARRGGRRRRPLRRPAPPRRADRDADRVRDDLTAYVREHLDDPAGVLIVDETGFLKKGTKSAGVQRQYSGTAGPDRELPGRRLPRLRRPQGHALLDRELYLPEAWAGDADRRKAARHPRGGEVRHQAAARRADDRAGVEVRHEARLGDRRRRLRQRRPTSAGRWSRTARPTSWRSRATSVSTTAGGGTGSTRSPTGCRRSRGAGRAGAGSKGPRVYDWAAESFGEVDAEGRRLWLLVRRHRERRQERAYYLCRGPAETPWRELARVAGSRWAVEECFERAKGDCGLDEYEVRTWVGWHRHVTLSMFALASCRRSGASPGGPRGKGAPAADPTVGARGPAIDRGAAAASPSPEFVEVLDWSEWRRRHQALARTCHYKKRGGKPPD